MGQAAAQAPAAEPEPEPDIEGRALPKAVVKDGAEKSQPAPKRRDLLWPRPGTARAELPKSGLARFGDLPVRVGPAGAAKPGTVDGVQVQVLAPEVAAKLGGVGLAARVVRADGGSGASPVRAEFSYAGFRDAFGGNFPGRLRLVRLPVCALQVPRPDGCLARPEPVKSVNDIAKGVLVAEVPADPATAGRTATPGKRPSKAAQPALGAEKTKEIASSGRALASAQLSAGSVYLLMAGLAGPDGNFGATDLKPSGTWQAGTSGGEFSYDLPIPEPPSPGGNGPGLSLGYSASSLDGQGDWTNNQSGVVGAGWDLNTGFIERRFRRCEVDYFYDEEANQIWLAEQVDGGHAVCWESPDLNDGDAATNDLTQSDLTLNVAGRSAQIVLDRTSGTYKTVPDLGWKVERATGGADGFEYWRLISAEGTVYRFGFNRDSQWRLPYVGNNFGEPCSDRYWADFSPPTCNGVWRWNLDREIDGNENVIDYAYTREANNLCFPSCFHEVVYPLAYDRGGFLSQVTYGHNTQVVGSVPTARITLTTADRGGTDVPTDLRCDTFSGCGNRSIAFFSTRKLTTILTEAKNPSGTWDPVNQFALTHSWIYTRTDFPEVGPYDPVLWLDTVQQTGLAGGTIKLPPVDFDAVMVAGKMVYDDVSDWPDFLSWRMVPRVGGIGNGMGGRVEVVYGQNDTCSGGNGRDGTNYFSDHAGDCYKITNFDAPSTSWTLYYKQLVTKVTERDMVAGSPDMVTAYDYLGTPGWASPVAYGDPFYAPPSTDWRGYATVRTLTGSGTDPAGYTVGTETFLRGMGGTVTDFEGGTVSDVRALQGATLQEQSWQMTSFSPRTYAETTSSRYQYAITTTGNGPGVQDPVMVRPNRDRSRHKLANGTWRYTDATMTYNADGLPITVNDQGDIATTADNTCTSTTYARNVSSGAWMTSFPSVVDRRAGDNCATGTQIGKTVTLYDGGTNPATNSPSDGNITEVRSSASASTVSTTKATFDDYGRTLTSTDPMNKVLTTTYSPAVGWPETGITTVNPLNHSTTTRVSRLSGEMVLMTDANGKTAEFDYDALGRATTLWAPDQPRAGETPTATISYDLAWDGVLGQPTEAVRTRAQRLRSGTGGTAQWTSTYSYDDGFGRPREAQTASPAGGRIVTVTAYDPRGLTQTISEPAHNGAEPGSGLLNPAPTSLPQWTKTLYDDQERPTTSIAYHLGTELRRTTVAYPGADRAEVTPSVGGKTATITDALGRTVKVEEWLDATTHHDTTYGYDRDSRLTQTIDAKGNLRSFTLDWLGRRTAATDPDSGSSSFGYDAAGRLLWAIDGRGQKISNTYDDLGRRSGRWAGEVGTGTKLAEWTYDAPAKGQPSTATRYTGGQAYTRAVTAYDSSYRPTTTTVTIPSSEDLLAGSYTFTAAYTTDGSLHQVGMPAAGGLPAETISHSYTDLGLVEGMSSDLGGTFTYVKDTGFTATGKLATRSLGTNGQILRTLERDPVTEWLSRITTQTEADTATPETVQDDRFSYDVAGKITRVLDAASAIGGVTDGQSECFGYDGLRRLTAAWTTTVNTAASSCPAGSADGQGIDPYQQAYTYDQVGNLASLTDNGQVATYAYPTAGPSATRPNAVTSITRPGGTDTYAYDNAGQLTSRTVSGVAGTFTWNPLGQLDSATIGGAQTSMVYDAEGERLIRRDPDGATTLYLGPMELTLSGGQVAGKRYYTTADEAMIAIRDGGGLTWLLSGLHGSQQLAVNATTGTISRERYLPFGERRGTDDLPFTDRGWLGKTEDDSTGLTYLSARYYDPAIAKFISTDPLLDLTKPEWANPYSYAGNNPIGQSDPSGLATDGCGDGSGRAECAPTIQAKLAKGTPLTKAEIAEHGFNTHYSNLNANDKRKVWMAWKAQTNPKAVNAWIKKTLAERNKRDILFARDVLWAMFLDDYPECARGDAIACAGIIPWGKALSVPAQMLKKLISKGDEAVAARKAKSDRCRSSFVPGTKVLMADGTLRPIEQVKVGDIVLASDPVEGRTTASPVAALITSQGDKVLVQITVNIGDQEDLAGASTLTSTDNHPFWVVDQGHWLTAAELQPGMWLRTSAGTHIQVSAVAASRTPAQRVHNLTVADMNTYYVLAGATPVLVHNAKCIVGAKQFDHAWDQHRWGGAYHRAGQMENVFARGIDKNRLRRMIDEAIKDGTVVARAKSDPRGGYYIDYDFGDVEVGAMGQNGIRIAVDAQGNFVTAMPRFMY